MSVDRNVRHASASLKNARLTLPPAGLDAARGGQYLELYSSNLNGGRMRRGFSLVELIVVMVIIGLLASLVAIRTRSYLIASKQNAARAEIATIVKALETFYADQSRYPTNEEGIQILTVPTAAFPDGFLTKVPNDPWKNRYEYFSPGSNGPYEVVCLGSDGREGGEGGDLDISSVDLE